MKRLLAIIVLCGGICSLFTGCKSIGEDPYSGQLETDTTLPQAESLIHADGDTISERFEVPPGFVRQESDAKSFAHYLQNLPLKPDGTKVKYCGILEMG